MQEFLLWLALIKGVNPEHLTKEAIQELFHEFIEYCRNSIASHELTSS